MCIINPKQSREEASCPKGYFVNSNNRMFLYSLLTKKSQILEHVTIEINDEYLIN